MDNIAFQIGGLTIYWYGVLAAIGFLAAFWTASRRAELIGISRDAVMDIAPWLIVGTLVGARSYYVVTHWQQHFASLPWWEMFMLRKGGMVYYGGLVGASLSVIFYVRYKKLPLWKIGDICAPSVALGHAIGRFGCLMNGCCYGTATSIAWGVRYPKEHETHPDFVHPTQVYESLLNFGLYVFLAWLFRRRKYDGQVFVWYLLGYALIRTFVERFRGDYRPAEMFGFLTPGQAVSAITLAIGIALALKLPRRPSETVVTSKP